MPKTLPDLERLIIFRYADGRTWSLNEMVPDAELRRAVVRAVVQRLGAKLPQRGPVVIEMGRG